MKVGQIWREVDPRFNRFIRIESESVGLRVQFRAVVKMDDGSWRDVPTSRCSFANEGRFNGKRGGYALHEDVPAYTKARP